MLTSDGIPMTPKQEKEAALVKRLAEKYGWEIESIHRLHNSLALEYKLRTKESRPDSERNYCIVRGFDTLSLSDRHLEAYLEPQLQNCKEDVAHGRHK